MKTNREKFLNAVTAVDSKTVNGVEFRNANRGWLKKSKHIALKVLMALKEKNMTQKDLATEMNVSPQYINKIVKGKENLTIETISKIEEVLNIEILITNNKRNQIVFPEYNASYNGHSYSTSPIDNKFKVA